MYKVHELNRIELFMNRELNFLELFMNREVPFKRKFRYERMLKKKKSYGRPLALGSKENSRLSPHRRSSRAPAVRASKDAKFGANGKMDSESIFNFARAK